MSCNNASTQRGGRCCKALRERLGCAPGDPFASPTGVSTGGPPCLGFTETCGDLLLQFRDLEQLRGWRCGEFPDPARNPAHSVLTGLAMIAIVVPIKALAYRVFDFASGAHPPRIGLAWRRIARFFLGEINWAFAGDDGGVGWRSGVAAAAAAAASPYGGWEHRGAGVPLSPAAAAAAEEGMGVWPSHLRRGRESRTTLLLSIASQQTAQQRRRRVGRAHLWAPARLFARLGQHPLLLSAALLRLAISRYRGFFASCGCCGGGGGGGGGGADDGNRADTSRAAGVSGYHRIKQEKQQPAYPARGGGGGGMTPRYEFDLAGPATEERKRRTSSATVVKDGAAAAAAVPPGARLKRTTTASSSAASLANGTSQPQKPRRLSLAEAAPISQRDALLRAAGAGAPGQPLPSPRAPRGVPQHQLTPRGPARGSAAEGGGGGAAAASAAEEEEQAASPAEEQSASPPAATPRSSVSVRAPRLVSVSARADAAVWSLESDEGEPEESADNAADDASSPAAGDDAAAADPLSSRGRDAFMRRSRTASSLPEPSASAAEGAGRGDQQPLLRAEKSLSALSARSARSSRSASRPRRRSHADAASPAGAESAHQLPPASDGFPAGGGGGRAMERATSLKRAHSKRDRRVVAGAFASAPTSLAAGSEDASSEPVSPVSSAGGGGGGFSSQLALDRSLALHRAQRRALAVTAAAVAAAWGVLWWFCLSRGMAVYDLLGQEAEGQFLRGWGIGACGGCAGKE